MAMEDYTRKGNQRGRGDFAIFFFLKEYNPKFFVFFFWEEKND